jgi:acetyl-CoA carboxylase biotin carboxyl carrier protein
MDLKELFALIEKFEKSGLSELSFKGDGGEVFLKKGLSAEQVAAYAVPAPVHVIPAPAVPHAGPASPAGAARQPESKAAEGEVIRAPIVGTFYRAAAPDAAPYVEKGSSVKKGQTLCIIEAMKLMNEFQAEFDLVVVNILADNGKMVEFGAPLFEVRRA